MPKITWTTSWQQHEEAFDKLLAVVLGLAWATFLFWYFYNS